MLLSVKERIVISNILPKQSSFMDYGILQDLKQDLSFSEDERERMEMKQDGDYVIWNQEKEEKKNIKIGKRGIEIIISSLKRLDEENKIDNHNADVYKRFVIDLKEEYL